MTSYEEYLSDLRACINGACKFIPNMCNALKNERPSYSNNDIRDQVTKDCLKAGLAKSTIRHNIPKEFKNPVKVEAGQKGAAKKKLVVLQTTSGAAVSAAEKDPESQYNPNLGSFEEHKKNYINKEIDDTNEWQLRDEDVEILKNELNRQTEENRQKDSLIQRLQEEKSQLSEVIRKNSFTQATNYRPEPPKKLEFPEPDESNTFVWKDITFDQLRMKLGPLKATGNTKINVYLERVVV